MPPKNVRKPAHSSASVLYYAMIGDIIGAPYEFNANNIFDPNFELFKKPERFKKYKAEFTDDSILTAAIAKMVRTSDFKDERGTIDNGIRILKDFVKKYPSGSFPGDYGGMFKRWAQNPEIKTMEEWSNEQSFGNGAAMRASAIGWAFGTLEETLKAAELQARISQSHPEGIKGSQAIAAAVYLARSGVDKKDIKAYIETKFGYDLDRTLDEHRNYNKNELKAQTESCQTTVPMALRVFLDSDSTEDCFRKAVSIGGDSDTIACIACSVGGAYFGMPKWLEENVEARLDDTLKAEAKAFQDFVNEKNPVADQEELDKVLALARVESHVLQKYKENNTYVPSHDPDFADLLARKEAVRLYYEEEKRLPASKDINKDDKAIILADSKDEFIDALTETIKSTNSFMMEVDDYRSCPVKMEDREDTDNSPNPNYNKRKAGAVNTFRKKVEVVEHEKIKGFDVPDNIVKTSLEKVYNKNFGSLRLKQNTLEMYESSLSKFNEEMLEADANGKLPTTADGWYKAVEDLISPENDNARFFPNGIPEDMRSAFTDLKNIKDDPWNSDPLRLSDNALTKLQNCFEKIVVSDRGENPDKINQLMYVTRITNAVNHWREAPAAARELSTIENEKDKLDDILTKCDDKILVGVKTKDYYKAVIHEMCATDTRKDYLNLWDDEHYKVNEAMTDFTFNKDEEALQKLKAISDKLNEKAAHNNVDSRVTRKIAFIDRLIDTVSKAGTAPEPEFDPKNEKHQAYDRLYKELASQANLIKRRIDQIPIGSRMHELANAAKQHIENLKEAAGQAFMQNSDEPLNNYIEGNPCLETLAAYQQKLSTYILSRTNPKGKSKSEIAAINAAKEEIKEFNDPEINPSISMAVGEMSNDTFETFKDSLSDLSQLTNVMKAENGMIKAFEKAEPGIRKAAEAAEKEYAKAEAARLKEEAARIKKEEAEAAKAKELDTAKRGLEETYLMFGDKKGKETEYSASEYIDSIRYIENCAKKFPKDPDIHKSCKYALAALIKNANNADKKSPNKNIASSIRKLFKNETPNAGKLFKELVSDSKKATAEKAAAEQKANELERDRRIVYSIGKNYSVEEHGERNIDISEYRNDFTAIKEIVERYPNELELLKRCGETVNVMLEQAAVHDAAVHNSDLSDAIANDKEICQAIQESIKKGSIAERQLKEAEKAKQQEEKKNEEAKDGESKQNEGNLIGK